ncbi:MAG: chorismate-binding protein [Bacteroidota bacterium]
MSSFLAYRFPGKEQQLSFGSFREFNPDKEAEGFIVTNFDLSQCYVFVEEGQNSEASFFEGMEKPYVMTAREYYLQAHELLNGLNLMQMEKAVFSRVKSVSFDLSHSMGLFDELAATYPNAFVYLFSDEKLGTWIGASPEILLEAHKGFVFTMALAGTRKNDESGWGEKEMHEQQIVTDYITGVCKKAGLKSIETEGPYDFEAGPVTHLKTDISAELNGVPIWKLARSIHPSPAISGFPREQAIGLIHSVEPHQRGMYTGMIGSVSAESSKLYVNLRCAQLFRDQAFLYLGGGYTLQSIPEMEWIETENKSKTLIQCIQKIS